MKIETISYKVMQHVSCVVSKDVWIVRIEALVQDVMRIIIVKKVNVEKAMILLMLTTLLLE